MERIGFSTGSLALSDFGTALSLLDGRGTTVVELSALRWAELVPLLEAIPTLDLSSFHHVSVHAPSAFPDHEEEWITSSLREVALARGWPVVVHPDAIHRFDRWAGFGPLLCIENMDRRKVGGRSAKELKTVFECFPDASLCLDVAHVRQVDPSMTEAFNILREFGDRLVQVHISDLDAASRHVRLTSTAIRAYQEIADLIPPHIPAVIESPARPEQIAQEIARALEALGRAPVLTA
jgi:hypothetical protein